MATPVPASKNIITIEETDPKSALSSDLFQRLAGSVNYQLGRIYNILSFSYDGYYKVTSISDGYNGKRYIKNQVDISYYVLTNHIDGSSGTSSINFEVYDETNTLLGNLFSTPPSIDSGTGNGAVIGRDVTNSTDIEAGTGKVVGTLNYTTLNARWSLVPILSGAQANARNLHFDLALQET